ncbi:MAG: hypothetical protein JXA95_16050 [Spirochaetales bacterium]|nr:hypothetical protein [Spirochaetales bacterium]
MVFEKASPRQDFLLISYRDMGFLINRSQFSASTTLDEVTPIKNAPPYLTGVFPYNKEKILLFDYDAYLQDTFHCRRLADSRLCILMGREDFSPERRPLIEKLLKHPSLSRDYLGLIISAQAEIIDIPLDELFLAPRNLRSYLGRRGVYGCRFPREDMIQHFIDFEITLINALRGGGK